MVAESTSDWHHRDMRLLWCGLVMVVGCGGSQGTVPTTVSTPEQVDAFQRDMIDAHNLTRANALPRPSPALAPVVWSEEAEALALDWAMRCEFEHRPNNLMGENLAVYSISDVPTAEIAALWSNEANDYTYDNNSCRSGAQCGHYTQMVWRSSVRIGCAVAACDNIPGFGAGALWVCNYDPSGNYVGERPY
jgi:pathogenesis-related protein 1